MYWGNLCLPLVQLTWEIFWVNKNKSRKQSGGVYYHNIQHQIIMSYVLCAEGGIKILNFRMDKYMGSKNDFKYGGVRCREEENK